MISWRFFMTGSMPPSRNFTALSTRSRYSARLIMPVHTPLHRLIWKFMQGRSLGFRGRSLVHILSLKMELMSETVFLAAFASVYGPKYRVPLLLIFRVKITRGYSSSRVTAIYGYRLSSFF